MAKINNQDKLLELDSLLEYLDERRAKNIKFSQWFYIISAIKEDYNEKRFD